jgi:hypothetical protein
MAAPRIVELAKRRNEITDTDAWFARNQLPFPGIEVPTPIRASTLPEGLPAKVGSMILTAASASRDAVTLVYGPDYSGGRIVVVLDARRQPIRVFDFDAFARAPYVAPPGDTFAPYAIQRVRWAHAEGGVLYVATSHPTYARSSGGKNAFVSALDVETGAMRWQSDPLVANAANVAVRHDVLVTGYGFTAEPDFVYVLDRATGRTLAKRSVASGPEYLVDKAGTLFVRTYDHDYELRVEAAPAASGARR